MSSDDDALAWRYETMLAAGQIVRTETLLTRAVGGLLKEFSITVPRYQALTLMYWSREPMLMSEIARLLVAHPTSVTSRIDGLERDGLARREPHPNDRRATLVEITDEGREVYLKAVKKLREHDYTLRGLDIDELRTLSSLLARLRVASYGPDEKPLDWIPRMVTRNHLRVDS